MKVKALASSSKANSIYVDDGRTPLLLDAGLPLNRLRAALDFGLSKVQGVLVTHSHMDHARAAKDIMKAGLDCYMSGDTAEALGAQGHRLHVIKPLSEFRLGSWAVLPFDAPHDVPNLGYLLQSDAGPKALYLTDAPYCRYRFKGLTHILLGCNYALDILRENVRRGALDLSVKNRILKSHMSLETAKALFRANDLTRVEQVWLLHLSDDNGDAARFKREVAEVTGKPVYVYVAEACGGGQGKGKGKDDGELSSGDTVRYFDSQKRSRFGRVAQSG